MLAYGGGLGTTVQSLQGGNDVQGLQSIPANAAAWAQRNGCGPDPADRQIAADVTLRTFSCPGDGEVELYSIIGGGHTWPGTPTQIYPDPLVGPTTTSINATQIIWDFFRTHPLPGRIGG
jgi:polyhydroxybutyrate depolymerase